MASLFPAPSGDRHPAVGIGEHYSAVRARIEALVAPLSDADATVQPMYYA